MRGPKWTQREDDFLRAHYAEKGHAWCAEQLKRPEDTTKVKASILGVAKERRAWTDADDDFLRENYTDKGLRFCATSLRRSLSNIQVKATRLGLRSRRRTYSRYHEIIEEMYMAGVRIKTIADTLGMKPGTVAALTSAWGLGELREMQRSDLAREIAEKHGVTTEAV